MDSRNTQLHNTCTRLRSFSLIAFCLFAICGCGANRHNVQGKQFFETGRYGQAISSFQQALQAQPRNPDSYYNLAATFHQLGNQTRNTQTLTQAESLYRQAIQNHSEHTSAYRGLAVLMAETNRKQLAFDMLRDWMTRNPNSPEPRIELARLYNEYGDKTTATQLLSDALNVDHQNARALRDLGFIREESGDLQQAIANYQRAYNIDQTQNDLPQRIGFLQQRLASKLPTNPGNGWFPTGKY